MLLALLGAIAAAPIFWLLVPAKARKDCLAAASLIGLGLYDLWLPAVVLVLIGLLYAATRAVAGAARTRGKWIMLLGLAVLAALFAYNKLMTQGGLATALPTQGGIVLIGVSYFVLKAAAILVETTRRTIKPPSLLRLARWLVFLPTYPSGPIEEFRHFDVQNPTLDQTRIRRGLERILFGCVRAFILSHYLAEWATPIIHHPESHSIPILILGMYAATLRIYFDFSGYSEIAIGLAALYGYEIQENFDNPLMQRNIVDLWQRWHMTLTGWLRIYLFTPITRALMERGRGWTSFAIVTGQIITMVFCGLWHNLSLGFALWGFLHGLALIGAGLLAGNLGKRLPQALVRWWRRHPLAYWISAFITVSTFSAINILAVVNLPAAASYFLRLLGLS